MSERLTASKLLLIASPRGDMRTTSVDSMRRYTLHRVKVEGRPSGPGVATSPKPS